jgi:tripartite-type tricarboxylate transporter receptor subunit TctC
MNRYSHRRACAAAMGLDEPGSPPEEFAAFVKRDIARFAKVIKEAGIQPE